MIISHTENNKPEFSKLEKTLIGTATILGILGALFFIFAIFLFNHSESYDLTKKINDDKWGNLGSFISGVVGAVWSLVGVILFYLTLRLQRKELAFQREELELTRQELHGQKEQMILQNTTLIQQRFESTFFQLLNSQQAIVSSIDTSKYGDNSYGRDCFKHFYQYLANQFTNPKDRKAVANLHQSTVGDAEMAYYDFFMANQSDLGHYFRNLYNIFNFIETSDIDEKMKYSTFARDQLSNFELALLFYHGLSGFGRDMFRPLIEKYSILENLPKSLIFSENHLIAYKPHAFTL